MWKLLLLWALGSQSAQGHADSSLLTLMGRTCVGSMNEIRFPEAGEVGDCEPVRGATIALEGAAGARRSARSGRKGAYRLSANVVIGETQLVVTCKGFNAYSVALRDVVPAGSKGAHLDLLLVRTECHRSEGVR